MWFIATADDYIQYTTGDELVRVHGVIETTLGLSSIEKALSESCMITDKGGNLCSRVTRTGGVDTRCVQKSEAQRNEFFGALLFQTLAISRAVLFQAG